MAVADGKTRRSLTLPDEVWTAIDTAADMEHSSPAEVISTAMQHACVVPVVETDLAQVALDLAAVREDIKELVGLLERRFLDEPAPVVTAPVDTAPVTSKQALTDWYASNRVDWPAEAPLPAALYADTPPTGLLARLWRWLIYRQGRTV